MNVLNTEITSLVPVGAMTTERFAPDPAPVIVNVAGLVYPAPCSVIVTAVMAPALAVSVPSA